ncbi:hypothetical protein RRG08_031048 [Elysia crispata]|uniref:Uncharacterized protein n=1 Tax=Elysia crispata TaxID=231223 RepID=A0AAE1DEZ8_9GAST|nr:hypothetical protein RRG08_031048 [Elysia crispata]
MSGLQYCTWTAFSKTKISEVLAIYWAQDFQMACGCQKRSVIVMTDSGDQGKQGMRFVLMPCCSGQQLPALSTAAACCSCCRCMIGDGVLHETVLYDASGQGCDDRDVIML